jgi:predicted transcriptional regulator
VNLWKMDAGSKRRDKLGIIAQILEIAKEGALKTQIMYNANLSFAQLNEYLKYMLRIRLMDKFDANGKEVYIITGKGSDFLQRHCEITELLKEDNDITRNGKNGVKLPPQTLLKRT